MHRLALLFALLASTAFIASAAHAEIVIYQGTVGDRAVVVELSQPVESTTEPVAGRFFYPELGYDIPLRVQGWGEGKVEMSEEALCDKPDGNCHDIPEMMFTGPVRAAWWNLTASGDGATLSGTRAIDYSDPAPLAIELTRVATRPTPDGFVNSSAGLAAITTAIYFEDQPLSASPYDELRFTLQPLTEGPVQQLGEASFRYDVDPRTRFAYPRIVALPAADPAKVNAVLEARHRRLSLDALGCMGRQFIGMNQDVANRPYEVGTLGGYEDETVTVTYLSDHVMSWTESGSLFCGGASPYNHSNSYNLDVATGQPLDLALLFTGWKAYDWTGDGVTPADPKQVKADPDSFYWAPDNSIIDFVNARREKQDAEFEQVCIDPYNFRDMTMTFQEGDMVEFRFERLPGAIAACEGPLLTVPLTEARELLTSEASRYFPSLNDS